MNISHVITFLQSTSSLTVEMTINHSIGKNYSTFYFYSLRQFSFELKFQIITLISHAQINIYGENLA